MALTSKRLTRGPRKGQVVRGYIGKNGKFTAYRPGRRRKGDKVVGQKVNTRKASKRAGQTYEVIRDRRGRRIHRYRRGNRLIDVVVKARRKAKRRTRRRTTRRRRR